MRKLNKDYDAVPVSLKTDAVSISRDPAKTTHNRRVEVVANGAYVYKAKYDSRYKRVDIKSALEAIHNHKCAYCEFYDQVLHVEHYRPKNGYHWLAYSWDNLLLACQKCNGHKKDQFELSGVKVNAPADVDYSRIHSLADEYDAQERPKLINPEKVTEDELNAFIFRQDGSVSSTNERVDYTIRTCDLDRENLRNMRKKIFDDLKRSIKYIEYEDALKSWSKGEKQGAYKLALHKFRENANDPSSSFTLFRKYVIKNWFPQLSNIVGGIHDVV